MSELRQKLAGELLRDVAWEAVKPHVVREAVFLVVGLPLLDVAEAIASDDGARVGNWVQSGALTRPDRATLERWRDEDTRFATLIVSPFVLVQEEAVKKGGVERLCWGMVEGDLDFVTTAIWPAPVDHDRCFEAAGFQDFADSDATWEGELHTMIEALVLEFSTWGSPKVKGGEVSVAEVCLALERSVESDGIPELLIEFGPIEVRSGEGHPIFWVKAPNSEDFNHDLLLRKLAGGRRVDQVQLDWKALGYFNE